MYATHVPDLPMLRDRIHDVIASQWPRACYMKRNWVQTWHCFLTPQIVFIELFLQSFHSDRLKCQRSERDTLYYENLNTLLFSISQDICTTQLISVSVSQRFLQCNRFKAIYVKTESSCIFTWLMHKIMWGGNFVTLPMTRNFLWMNHPNAKKVKEKVINYGNLMERQ